MGGKGGHKKQVTKKTLLASAASAAAAAKSSSPKVRPRPSPTGSGHSEYSESETEAPARAMELGAPTTAAIWRDLSKRGRLAAPTPEGACVIPRPHPAWLLRGPDAWLLLAVRYGVAAAAGGTGRRAAQAYAFIEFKHGEVGEVVAKAMNGYLMYSKVLAKVLAP